MKKGIKVCYTCPACGLETEVLCQPIIYATYEHPEEGGEFEPVECDCGHEIDAEKIWEKVEDFYDGGV